MLTSISDPRLPEDRLTGDTGVGEWKTAGRTLGDQAAAVSAGRLVEPLIAGTQALPGGQWEGDGRRGGDGQRVVLLVSAEVAGRLT